ncbi:caspase-8 [Aplochiton taeniatus]
MNLPLLTRIDEDLDSSEVSALCFLCRDILGRKYLENVQDGQSLFLRLEERGLLENYRFLFQLLSTIGRADLAQRLETEDAQLQQMSSIQTDASPALSDYRIMLYNICEDVTQENLTKMKFLLTSKLGRGRLDLCNEAVRPQPLKHSLSISETQPSSEHTLPPGQGQSLRSDGYQEVPPCDTLEVYTMNHNPRGLCVIINNKNFCQSDLKDRAGTEVDESRYHWIYQILDTVKSLGGSRVYTNEDALVVCVLSHGQVGCVFGTDGRKVPIRDLTRPFTSGHCHSLAGKPKLFFIQACQGEDYQKGERVPVVPTQQPGQRHRQVGALEADAGPVEYVAWDADFLVGMATVEECMSFRHTTEGSIYIQELCKQLERAGESKEDILTVLTHVNRAVSRGDYRGHKQMPEPKYTLTKKLILSFL